MKKLCFLDMDGVIADFVKGVSQAHGRPSPYSDKNGKHGGGAWDMAKLWKISEEEFWKPTNNLNFWKNLDKTSEADSIVDLVNYLFGKENVCILTAPSESSWCLPGKKAWMQKNFPELVEKMIFTNAGAKHFMASEGRVLIDDRTKNIQQWEAAGGFGITCPRIWNDRWQDAGDVMRVIRERLEEFFR